MPQSPAHDTLILHPRIYLSARGERTDALRVRHGRVVATGDEARQRSAGSHVLRPEGACLFPALTDAHVHLWDLGMRVGLVDLKGTRSPDEVVERLLTREVRQPPSGWIEGHGWDEHTWPARDARLSLEQLDGLFPDTPLCLYRVDHHAGWVNTEALRRAGLLDVTHMEGGLVERDARGALTGRVVDEALKRVSAVIPEESDEELEAVFLEVGGKLRAHGVGCAHMAWSRVRGARMARRLFEAGRLPLRVALMLDAHDPELDAVLEAGPWRDARGWLAMDCIKFFADGAMGSRGALMLESYLDGTHGLAVVTAAELNARVPGLLERGWQVATHAIGDAAARAVLDAYALASRAARAATRPRLEHAQLMTAEDIRRMGELGVIASIQPIHMHSDAPWAARVMQPHQLERLFNWRDLQRVTTLAGGSDYPIDDLNPWHGIATAITRRDATGRVWREEQALTREEALLAYTQGAAYAARWEGLLGCLDVGYEADVIALSADPLTCSAEALWEQRATWVTCDR